MASAKTNTFVWVPPLFIETLRNKEGHPAKVNKQIFSPIFMLAKVELGIHKVLLTINVVKYFTLSNLLQLTP